MSGYKKPKSPCSNELIVKKSRFIAYAYETSSREAAMEKLEQIRLKYPDARHHCWAYLLGSTEQPKSVAMSDDGEPSGTAGKPILNVLQHKDVGDIMVIVVRYFGGIKLGAGGLVRAYSSAAQSIYDLIETEEMIELESLTLQCGFDEEQKIRHILSRYEGSIESSEYGQSVELSIAIPAEEKQAFVTELGNLKSTHFLQESD